MPGPALQPFSMPRGFRDAKRQVEETYTLRPNGDSKADWTEVPGGLASDRLNEVIIQPSVPDTGTNYIESATNPQICRLDVNVVTLGVGEIVAVARLWVYIDTASRGVTTTIMVSGTVVRETTFPAGTVGWRGLTLAAPLTQAQVDSLQMQFTTTAGSGTARIYATYFEVNTRTDIWESVNSKFRYNRDATSGLTVGAGFFGSDMGPSVDIGGGRSIQYGGDAGFATASGQQFYLGNNVANPSAPRVTFVRNMVMLIDSYNLEAANFWFYTGPGLVGYHPDHPTYGGRWPYKSFVHDGRLYTVGRFVTTAVLAWAAYTDDFTGNPDTWTWTYAPAYTAFAADRGNGEWGIWDDGAGTVYMWSAGPQDKTQSLCRLNATEFHNLNWVRPEWWTGDGWLRDKPGMVRSFPRGVYGRKHPRENLYRPIPDVPAGQGSVHRRVSDNRFQATTMDDPLSGSLPFQMRYALTPSTVPTEFNDFFLRYTLPEGERFCYGPSCHPQLTWPGMSSSDQVWSYASNWPFFVEYTGDERAWEPMYFTRFVKAYGVTAP